MIDKNADMKRVFKQIYPWLAPFVDYISTEEQHTGRRWTLSLKHGITSWSYGLVVSNADMPDTDQKRFSICTKLMNLVTGSSENQAWTKINDLPAPKW